MKAQTLSHENREGKHEIRLRVTLITQHFSRLFAVNDLERNEENHNAGLALARHVLVAPGFAPDRSRNMAHAIETISTMKAMTVANLMNAKKSPKTMINRLSIARANITATASINPRPIPRIPMMTIPATPYFSSRELFKSRRTQLPRTCLRRKITSTEPG